MKQVAIVNEGDETVSIKIEPVSMSFDDGSYGLHVPRTAYIAELGANQKIQFPEVCFGQIKLSLLSPDVTDCPKDD